MKVCLINSLYAPDTRGGAEQIVQNTAQLLKNAGHDTVVISTKVTRKDTNRNTKEHEYEMVDGVQVYRVSSANLGSFYNYTHKPLWLRLLWLGIDLVNPFPARAVKKILQQEQPDVVHVHNMRGLSYLLPRVIKKLNIKHVQTLHDIQYAYPMGLLIKGEEQSFVNTFFLRTWYEKFCAWLLGSPDVVISPSQWLLDFYTKRGFFKSSQKEVVANPIKDLGDRIYDLGFKKNKENISLVFVGQIESHKGIFTLLEALKIINLKSYLIHLTVIGDGSQLNTVKAQTRDDENIHILGRLPNEEVQKHIAESDVLIMPTLTYENFPTVILESHAHGVPVIASIIGGIPEMIQEGKTGWLFEAGNTEALSQTITQAIEMLKDSETTQQIAQQCKKNVERYSEEIYLRKLQEIYQ